MYMRWRIIKLTLDKLLTQRTTRAIYWVCIPNISIMKFYFGRTWMPWKLNRMIKQIREVWMVIRKLEESGFYNRIIIQFSYFVLLFFKLLFKSVKIGFGNKTYIFTKQLKLINIKWRIIRNHFCFCGHFS